ncbi:MAG: diguanylate cyclase [Candidatus Gygaella obscura]|nr:diguanylate cyclase [Candidatus Gygaella obscura]
MQKDLIIYIDELTELYNRRYLSQVFPKELKKAQEKNYSLWFFMMDLDNFKGINDTLGHLAGDDALKSLAVVLKKNMREQDILFRYAGDEFSAIIPGGTLSDVLAVAKRILENVARSSFGSNPMQPAMKFTVSIGISCFPEDAVDTLRLIDLADKALYVSKRKGKNHISVVSDVPPEVLSLYQILEKFPCPVFIDRVEELNQLFKATDEFIAHKKKKNIFIFGNSGIGKTRILHEYGKRISSKNISLIVSHANEKDIFTNYHIFIDGISDYFKTHSFQMELLEGLDDKAKSILVGFIPDLKRFVSVSDTELKNLSGKSIKDEEIKIIFKKFISNICKKHSLCFVVDDLQWTDKASLDLLKEFNSIEESLMVIAAVSNDYVVQKDNLVPLSDFITKHSLSFERLDVKPFEKEQAAKMVNAVFNSLDNLNEFTSLLFSVTKGSPLFIEELLKYFINRGFVFYRKGKWGWLDIRKEDLPSSIEEVVAQRIKSLSSELKEVITQASVIGEGFELNLLQKLGKKNQGYLMDLIETAKKSGLIREEKGAEGTRFVFTSAKVKDVLYGLADKNEIKNLNRQIGQIKEEIYKGNEDQVAGELYYRFKKAEDEKKATRYAKMVKEGRSFVYEKSIHFAKGLLEEVQVTEQEIPDKVIDGVSDIVRLIYVSQINSSLYPKGSSMRTQPLADLISKLKNIFEYVLVVSFSHFNEFLVVNNRIYDNESLKGTFRNAFIGLLKQNKIEKISFFPSLSVEELENFLELFESSEKEIFKNKFNQEEFANIKVEYLSYENYLSKRTKDREQLQDIMLLDYLLGKVPGEGIGGKMDILDKIQTHSQDIASALTKMADKVSKQKGVDKDSARADILSDNFKKISQHIFNKGEGAWDKYKKGLANTILSLEPNLRDEVLHKQLEEDKKNAALENNQSASDTSEEAVSFDNTDESTGNLKKDALKDQPQQDIIKALAGEFPEDVVLDLIKKEYKDGDNSPEQFKEIVLKFLPEDNDQKKTLMDKISKLLKEEGASEEELKFLTQEEFWPKLGFSEKIIDFMNMASDRYVYISNKYGFNPVMEFALSSETGEVKKILERLVYFIESDSLEAKKIAKQDLLSLIDLVFTYKKSEFLELLINTFIAELRKEHNEETTSIFINHIEKLTYVVFSMAAFDLFSKVINELKKLVAEDNTSEDMKANLSLVLSHICSDEIVQRLIERLFNYVDSNEDYSQIIQIFVAIGKQAANRLIDEAMFEKNINVVGYFGGYLRRKAVGNILNMMDKNDVMEFIKNRLQNEKWFIVRNTIDLIMHIDNPEYILLLGIVKDNNDSRVRRKLLFVLGRFKSKQALDICYSLANDRDDAIAMGSIKLIASIGDKDSLDFLNNLSVKHSLRDEKNKAIEELKERLK